MRVFRGRWLAVFVLASLAGSSAQLSDAAKAKALLEHDYEVIPDITYFIANRTELRLDIYQPREAKGPTPVVMFIHGGGWVEGSKERDVLGVLPYLQMGFSVVNVEYRLGHVSLAPPRWRTAYVLCTGSGAMRQSTTSISTK